jgi:hypothetical protein
VNVHLWALCDSTLGSEQPKDRREASVAWMSHKRGDARLATRFGATSGFTS